MERKWWHDKIACQLYPKSYQDSDGDGINFRIGCISQYRVSSNASVFIKRKKTGIHRDQIISRRGIDETVDLRDLVITDHVADRRIDDHDLECRGDTTVSSHHKG